MSLKINSPKSDVARIFVSDYYLATNGWEHPVVRSSFEGILHAVWMTSRYKSPFANPELTKEVEMELFKHSAGLGFAVGCLDACVLDVLDLEDDVPGAEIPVTADMERHANEWMRSGVVNFRNVSDALAPADTMGLLVVNFSHGYVGGVNFVDRVLTR